MMLCDHQTDDNMTRSQAADDVSACWNLLHPTPRPHREALAGRIDAGPAVPLALFASSSTGGSVPDPAPAAAATARSTGSGPYLAAAFAGGGGSGFQLPLCAFESRYAAASAAAAAAAAAGPRSLPPACVPAPLPPPAYAPEPLPPLPPLTAAGLSLDAPLQRLSLQPPAAGMAGSWAGEYRSLPGFRAYPGRPGPLAGR